jgi:hypothetical protein
MAEQIEIGIAIEVIDRNCVSGFSIPMEGLYECHSG